MVQLRTVFVYSIDVHRTDRVFFIYGKALRTAIELPSATVYDAGRGIRGTACFEQAQVRLGVSAKILHRVPHGVGVTDVARHIKDDIDAGYDFPQF
jgi:hypothetical protein